MLIETQVSGKKSESQRRWFSDNEFDLITWQDASGKFVQFQLCYNKSSEEHALSWDATRGCSHTLVDDGDNPGFGPKMSPVLVSDGAFDKNRIAADFKAASAQLDPRIVEFVLDKIDKGFR